MTLHAELLEQVQHLARRERRRPRQAGLHRAVSSAYYALFHMLISEATSRLVAVPALRNRFARAFERADMKRASQAFVNPQANQLAALTGGLPVPPNLQQVAETFVELQERRHDADYNVARSFTRSEVADLVAQVKQAFLNWQSVRGDPVAGIYLTALLLWRKWSR